MGKFRLYDRNKQAEGAAIRGIIASQVRKFDHWIDNFFDYQDPSNSPTPPTEEQARRLEDEQIDMLVQEFDTLIVDLTRIKSQWPWRRKRLMEALEWRRGALYQRCWKNANVLQEAARSSMDYCEQTFKDFQKGMDDLINAGTNMSELNTVFNNLVDVCNYHIDDTFPGGRKALENYYEDMPKDIISYRDFFQLVEKSKEEYKEKLRKARFNQMQKDDDTPLNCLKASFAKVLDAQQHDPELFLKYCQGKPILLNS
mmetsp:Transcript_46401/g.112485  ORF Transcript_46401/g.112485 Transcript_46401/m.112485 type:complete len:256 (-) Transcript_46401:2231-2998(-)